MSEILILKTVGLSSLIASTRVSATPCVSHLP